MRKTLLILVLSIVSISLVQAGSGLPESKERVFNKNAGECLEIMEKAAKEMSITGVAMIAYIPGSATSTCCLCQSG
jgi:hypothetical protein